MKDDWEIHAELKHAIEHISLSQEDKVKHILEGFFKLLQNNGYIEEVTRLLVTGHNQYNIKTYQMTRLPLDTSDLKAMISEYAQNWAAGEI